MYAKRNFVIFLLLAIILFPAFSQSIKDLQAQKAKLQEELKMTNKLLIDTKKSAASSETKLAIIRQTIASRKVLIENLSLQINALDRHMDTLQSEKTRLSQRLSRLRADYARLLQEAQIRKSSYSQLLFLFSSESIGQAYRRLRYLQESSDYRKKQAYEILGVQETITHKQNEIVQAKQSKVVTLSQKEQESKQLQSEQSKENQSLSELKKKNKELQAQLTKQQRQANALNARIERAILEEMRREEARREAARRKEQQAREAAAAKKAAADRAAAERAAKKQGKKTKQSVDTEEKVQTPVETAKPVPAALPATSAYVDMMTKEEALVSGNFAANRGRLPWPVEKGYIRGHFGIQPHPVLKHVTTNNKGIYIQAPRNSDARAVFDGVVTQRFAIPGNNNAIIIRHGNYRTVYANLTSIYVNVGDHVSPRQRIGKIFVDDENGGKTELYMMLWQDKTLLNPESWLAR
ncbi:MAG: peptidoglycan DD-metalloendopeptidase family protein [Bacteroidota bacterium]|nr:peptidoglycan DD-metalloendopeptidase family protein [Bacteroidota bacterium]